MREPSVHEVIVEEQQFLIAAKGTFHLKPIKCDYSAGDIIRLFEKDADKMLEIVVTQVKPFKYFTFIGDKYHETLPS